MATLQEILDDQKTFEDGIELEIKGQKVTLGGLRELSAGQQKKLSAELTTAETRRKQAESDALKAAEILNNLQTLEKTTREKTPPEGSEDDFDTNNWWTPVRKRLSPIEEQLKGIAAEQKKSADALARAATIWAEERWHNQFEKNAPRLQRSAKHKAMTYEEVRDYAAKNNLLDNYGFPSVERAVADLTKEDEMKMSSEEAYQKGLREGATRARLNSSPRPTSASGGKGKTLGLDSEKNFEDLGDAIADDPELSEMLAQVQGINPDEVLQ